MFILASDTETQKAIIRVEASSKSSLTITGDNAPLLMDSSGSSSNQDKKSKDNEHHEAKEAKSTAQHFVDFTEAEEDLALRMHRLVGNRWELIAGRIPGRTAEEVEMFWSKRHQEK